jgi:hypothetical protein
MISLCNDCAVVLNDDATGIAPYNCEWLLLAFSIVCSHTTVKAFDGDALVLVVDCPPDVLASLRQRFVEVVEESHGLPSCPTQPMPE